MIVTALSRNLSCLSVGILKILEVNVSEIFENSRLWGARETVFCVYSNLLPRSIFR